MEMPDFPPPPVETIEWTKMVERKIIEVHGHIEAVYSRAENKWSPLHFVASPYVRIHGMAPALNYGQQALEGFKAFRMPGNPGEIALFRPDRNAMRFQKSAEALSMPVVPTDMFLRACRTAVALNADYVPPHESGGALYIRPQLFGSSAQLGLYPPDEFTFQVYVVPSGVYYGTKPLKGLILHDFDRAAPKGVGHAKVGGNYAPVMRWSEQAKAEGFGITLHLDSARREQVDEFSTCAFIGVYSGKGTDDVALVFPDSPCAIDSVTSDSMQHIARQFGWKVEKRPVYSTELSCLDEVLGAGTSVGLVPVRSISCKRTTGLLPASARVRVDADYDVITYIADDQDSGGWVYLKLLAQLRAIQLGDVEDEFGWRFLVRAEDQNVDGSTMIKL